LNLTWSFTIADRVGRVATPKRAVTANHASIDLINASLMSFQLQGSDLVVETSSPTIHGSAVDASRGRPRALPQRGPRIITANHAKRLKNKKDSERNVKFFRAFGVFRGEEMQIQLVLSPLRESKKRQEIFQQKMSTSWAAQSAAQKTND
jgi:hypothetical protein